jgi:hypothetical protein
MVHEFVYERFKNIYTRERRLDAKHITAAHSRVIRLGFKGKHA